MDELLADEAVTMPAPWVGLGILYCRLETGQSRAELSGSPAAIQGARPLNRGSFAGNVDMSQYGSRKEAVRMKGGRPCKHLASCVGGTL